MSVQFNGGELSLSNGAASELLRAIGYPVGEDSDGEMTIEDAERGVDKALKDVGMGSRRIIGLVQLSEIVGRLRDSGHAMLRWS